MRKEKEKHTSICQVYYVLFMYVNNNIFFIDLNDDSLGLCFSTLSYIMVPFKELMKALYSLNKK